MKGLLSLVFALILCGSIEAQTFEGIWKTIDDNTGETKSLVEIKQVKGNYVGQIIKLLNRDDAPLCVECVGAKKNQPIIGLEIIWDMKLDNGVLRSGQILDPENGKNYSCRIKLEGSNTLKVRGFIGSPILGRTQVWHRV